MLNQFTSSFEPKQTCFELFDLWSVECIIPGNMIEERLWKSGGGKILPCKKGSGGGGEPEEGWEKFWGGSGGRGRGEASSWLLLEIQGCNKR